MIVIVSSIAIKNGLSSSLAGEGIYSSTASINAKICFLASGSPSIAFNAEPRIIGQLSPSNPYLSNNSRTVISAKSMNSS